MEEVTVSVDPRLKLTWDGSKPVVVATCYSIEYAINQTVRLRAIFKNLDSFSVGQVRWLIEQIPEQIIKTGVSVFRSMEVEGHILIEASKEQIKISILPQRINLHTATLWRKSKMICRNDSSPRGWSRFTPQDHMVYI